MENIGKINAWWLGQANGKIRVAVFGCFFFSAASKTMMCGETSSEFSFGT